jgi:hypothetical protein
VNTRRRSSSPPLRSSDEQRRGDPKDSFWRRHRSTLLIVGAFVAAVLVVIWSTDGGHENDVRFDPSNPGPDGAQALARVLEDEGVDVHVARSADAFGAEEVGADTTVVVTSTEQLGERTLDRLLSDAQGARLVFVEPSPLVTAELGLSGYPETHGLGDGRDAGCDDPLFDGLTMEVDQAIAYPGEGCFADAGSAVVVERDGSTLFGAGEAMTNDQVLRADNAAVALRLLGQSDDLVWYVPTYDDLLGDEEVGIGSLLPRWIEPGLWLLLVAGVFLVVWRARRLGRLATEPLPVVIKAIETTRSRGRLYRKAGDRAHAAAALRAGARRRAAVRLRLGAGHTELDLVRDLARHSGRSEQEVAALVGSDAPAPPNDHDLIRLAGDLAGLDREVRRS